MNGLNVNRGTTELFVNGLMISSERFSEITEYYQTKDGMRAIIKCKLLGYFKSDGFVGLPELKEYLNNLTILDLKLIEKSTGKVRHEGEGIVKNIKISYPDDDVSVITVKFCVG